MTTDHGAGQEAIRHGAPGSPGTVGAGPEDPAQPDSEPHDPETEPYAQAQLGKRYHEKQSLADFVTDKLIAPETTIFLDAGSTMATIATALFKRENSRPTKAEHHRQMKLCIVTNNMIIFRDFNNFVRDNLLPGDHSLSLVMTGGEYDRQHEALFGCVTEASLDAVKCHIAVMGTSGLSLQADSGIHSHALTAEKVTKNAIFGKRVQHRIIVCDHSKIGREDTLLCGEMRNVLKNADRCTIVVGTPWFADCFIEWAAAQPDARPDQVTEVVALLRRESRPMPGQTASSGDNYFSRDDARRVAQANPSAWPDWADRIARQFDDYERGCNNIYGEQSDLFAELATTTMRLAATVKPDDEGILRLFRVLEGGGPEQSKFGPVEPSSGR